jgi:hypothetical protein
MSASMTVSDVNQGLSIGALGAWLVGVPSEVVIGGLAGAVIFVTFAAEYPIKRGYSWLSSASSAGFSSTNQRQLSSSALPAMLPGVTRHVRERCRVLCRFVRSAIVAVRIGIMAVSPF